MSDSPRPEDFTGGGSDDGEIFTTRRKLLAGALGGSVAGGYGLSRLYDSRTDEDLECPSYGVRDDIARENNLMELIENIEPDDEGYHTVSYDEENDNWYIQRSFIDTNLQFERDDIDVDDTAMERILERAEGGEYEWGEEILERC